MLTIWKFSVPNPSQDIFHIAMPENAKILSYQYQDGSWVVWALVDPNAGMVQRKFVHIGTGWKFENLLEKCQYIGTTQVDGFVWHLFEYKD